MNTLRLGPVWPDKPNRIHARVEPHESQDERKSFKSSEGDERTRDPLDRGKTKLHTITDLTLRAFAFLYLHMDNGLISHC